MVIKELAKTCVCCHITLWDIYVRKQAINDKLQGSVMHIQGVSGLSITSYMITPILRSLHWLRITERSEYKLLSLTYKVLTTTQPSYLHNLIKVQPPRSTRSSSLVTLARPSTSSSLRITDRSFQYASPRLWNQLPASLR